MLLVSCDETLSRKIPMKIGNGVKQVVIETIVGLEEMKSQLRLPFPCLLIYILMFV